MTKDEIIDCLNTQRDIIHECLLLHDDFIYLTHPNSTEEYKAYANFQILWRARSAFVKLLHIELNKLIKKSNSHHYNILGFLDKLKTSTYATSLDIDKYISLIESKLGYIENPHPFNSYSKKAAGILNDIRDKHIAHTDKDRMKHNDSIYLKDIKILIDSIYLIINEMRQRILKESPIEQALFRVKNQNDLLSFLARGDRSETSNFDVSK
ncbi:MAG: hypothetical protein WC150_08305 [Bacteroidia bacterium]